MRAEDVKGNSNGKEKRWGVYVWAGRPFAARTGPKIEQFDLPTPNPGSCSTTAGGSKQGHPNAYIRPGSESIASSHQPTVATPTPLVTRVVSLSASTSRAAGWVCDLWGSTMVSMEQQETVSLADHDCLPLLLQHSSMSQDVKTICSLLCVCKPMRTSIAQQCRCQLALECSTQELGQVSLLAAFLRRWGGLAKTLELNWNRISLVDVETCLGDALQAAAAGASTAGAHAAEDGLGACTGALQIKALKANVAGPLLLGVMPASSLTALELGHVIDYTGGGTVAEALAKLTGGCRLRVRGELPQPRNSLDRAPLPTLDSSMAPSG